MRSDRGRTTRTTVYFVLATPGQPIEIARVTPQGSGAFYEPQTDSWINDPLLANEIMNDESWRPAHSHELPQGILVEEPQAPRSTRRRSRRRRRPGSGTHAA